MNAKRNKSGKLGKKISVHKDRIKSVNEAFERKKHELKLKGERLSYTLIASSYDSARKQSCRKEVSAFFYGEPVSEELFKYICKYISIPFATVAHKRQKTEFLRIHESRLGEMEYQRKSLDLTYNEIAIRCRSSESTIKRLFNKNAKIKKDVFIAVCKLLDKDWETISSGRGTKNHNIPFSPKPFIVPRSQELDSISRIQKQHRFVLIHGQGGIGKTTLAIQYALEQKADYPGGLLWLRCRSGSTSIPSQIEQFLTDQLLIDRPQTSNTTERVKALYRKWRRREQPALIIFDDPQNDEAIGKFLPPDDCGDIFKVIITSRNRHLLNGMVVGLEVGAFSSEQGAEVLNKIFQTSTDKRFEEEHINHEISKAVFNHPLAVVLVGHYFKQNIDAKVQLVLQKIRDVVSRIDNEEIPRGELSVKATFDLTYHCSKFAPARDVALTMSLFSNTPIKWEFVETIFTISAKNFQRHKLKKVFELYRSELCVISNKNLSKIKNNLLYGFHFLEFNQEDMTYSFHPLIKDYLQQKEQNAKTTIHQARFYFGIITLLVELSNDTQKDKIKKSHQLRSYLLPHANKIIDLTSKITPSHLYSDNNVVGSLAYIYVQVAELNNLFNKKDKAISILHNAINVISIKPFKGQSVSIAIMNSYILQRLGKLHIKVNKKQSEEHFYQSEEIIKNISLDDIKNGEGILDQVDLASMYTNINLELIINHAENQLSSNDYDGALVNICNGIEIVEEKIALFDACYNLSDDELSSNVITNYYTSNFNSKILAKYQFYNSFYFKLLNILAEMFRIRATIYVHKDKLLLAEKYQWKSIAILDFILEIQLLGIPLVRSNLLDKLASEQCYLIMILRILGKDIEAFDFVQKCKQRRLEVLNYKDINFISFYIQEIAIKGNYIDTEYAINCWQKIKKIIDAEINKQSKSIRNSIIKILDSCRWQIEGLESIIQNVDYPTNETFFIYNNIQNILREIKVYQEQIEYK